MKTKVQVIEVTGIKLNPKAKYIVLLSPEFADYIDPIDKALSELIGPNFTIWPVSPNAVKIYEVLPKEGKK